MADELEPRDPGRVRAPSAGGDLDIGLFQGVGRNEKCPCGSAQKFKNCHWDWIAIGASDSPPRWSNEFGQT